MEVNIETETATMALLKLQSAALQRRLRHLASAIEEEKDAATCLAWLSTARSAVALIATGLNELASVWEPNGTPSGEDRGEIVKGEEA